MVPNIAVVAPIPMARVKITTAVKPGRFLIIRKANFTSAGKFRNTGIPPIVALSDLCLYDSSHCCASRHQRLRAESPTSARQPSFFFIVGLDTGWVRKGLLSIRHLNFAVLMGAGDHNLILAVGSNLPPRPG
jgi:hypothetical protein